MERDPFAEENTHVIVARPGHTPSKVVVFITVCCGNEFALIFQAGRTSPLDNRDAWEVFGSTCSHRTVNRTVPKEFTIGFVGSIAK